MFRKELITITIVIFTCQFSLIAQQQITSRWVGDDGDLWGDFNNWDPNLFVQIRTDFPEKQKKVYL